MLFTIAASSLIRKSVQILVLFIGTDIKRQQKKISLFSNPIRLFAPLIILRENHSSNMDQFGDCTHRNSHSAEEDASRLVILRFTMLMIFDVQRC